MPLLTYLNAPPTVVFVSNMIRILTSNVHHSPDAVFLLEVRLDRFGLASAMSLRVRLAEEVVDWDGHAFGT